MYVFLPEDVYSLNDAPDFDPHFWRLFGGALIAIGIVVLLGIIKGDWDNIKMLFLFAIILLIILALINITSNIYVTRSATNLIFHWLDTIVIIAICVFNIFFYLREEKK
ncbi:MAG: hypothetical protein HWN79_16645 [Candidatus Lokiarchaeota archaeon]|nr:hypothetical protein [Candidatus Lokiarchaeota archaeon]